MLRNKIETDVANVRTLFESYKNDVFRYSIGMFSEIMCIENKFQQGCVILLGINSFAPMSFYMYIVLAFAIVPVYTLTFLLLHQFIILKCQKR